MSYAAKDKEIGKFIGNIILNRESWKHFHQGQGKDKDAHSHHFYSTSYQQSQPQQSNTKTKLYFKKQRIKLIGKKKKAQICGCQRQGLGQGKLDEGCQKVKTSEFPLWLSPLEPDIVSMRIHVQSLALFSGLRIWHCHKMQCSSQMWFGSGVALAVVQASSCSSNSIPSLGNSICHRCGPKTKKKYKLPVIRLNKHQGCNAQHD